MILADCIPDNSKNRNWNGSKQNFLLGYTFYILSIYFKIFYCMEYNITKVISIFYFSNNFSYTILTFWGRFRPASGLFHSLSVRYRTMNIQFL